MVFSTSFGPRPGACVPMTNTGGVSSGNVSTLIRGVTTNANTTRAMAIISTAMGFCKASLVMRRLGMRRLMRLRGCPGGGIDPVAPRGAAHDLIAFLQQGTALDHDM